MSPRWSVLALFFVCAHASAQALPSTVQVAMPDGVTLATDVWRPFLDNKPRPVLLRRTPYGRSVDFNVAQALVASGYVLVSQDVRGRGGSQGEFEPFFDDKVDGKATIEWAASQPWSTGAVATYSNSAEGIVQYMAMANQPKGLRCAHVGMPTHDVYEGVFPGGAWRSELGTRWLTDLGAANVVDRWKAHEARDSYWDDATLSTTEMATIDHPVFLFGGFFDIFAPSEVLALQELQAHVVPDSRDDIFLVLGPWTHGGIGLRGQGDLFFPEDAPYTDWATEMLAYAKWCTQDGPRPEFAPVRYYLSEITDETTVDPADKLTRTIAKGEWRNSTTWPPPESRWQRLRAQDFGQTKLSVAVEADASVPSQGGGNLTTPAGPFDQAMVDTRPDVLLLSSQTVTQPLELIGSPTVRLWVSSATTDLDVIVRLEVVSKAGKAFALTDGVRRGRFVTGFDAVRPLKPGEPALFEIALGPVAVRLTEGQLLRLAISGSSSPRYEPNPNVATPLIQHPATVATTLTLDATRGELVLPVASGVLPGASMETPVFDAGVRDAGTDAGRRDAGIKLRDATIDEDAPGEPEQEDEGCACSTHSKRVDAGGMVIVALLLQSSRSRRSRKRRSA